MTPEQEKVASEILWQLAVTRAETRELKFLTTELLALKTGKPMTEIQDKHKTKKEEMAKALFLKSAKAAGLQHPSNPDRNWNSLN